MNLARYLSKNTVIGTENLRFEDVGHHYSAVSKYYGVVNSKECDGSLPLVSTTSILKDYFPSFESKKIYIATRILNSKNPNPKYKECRSLEDVLRVWENSANSGTAMHALFEDLCNIFQWEVDSGTDGFETFREYMHDMREKMYFEYFLEDFGFYDRRPRYRFFRTEFVMWHELLHISGMIDLLLYDTFTNTYVIVDWKRLGTGLKKNPKDRSRPLPKDVGLRMPAFKQLRNNDENKYGCQLTLYKNMLEYMSGGKMKVSAMYLIVVTADKIGQPEAYDRVSIRAEDYQSAIDQAFYERAYNLRRVSTNRDHKQLLERYMYELDDKYTDDELVKYII